MSFLTHFKLQRAGSIRSKACHEGGRFGRGCQAFTINVMNAAIDVKHLLPVWEQFRAATDITPIRDEAHYARMMERPAVKKTIEVEAKG